jgi:sulfiredoxin
MLKRQSVDIEDIYVPVKRRQTLDPKKVDALAESILAKGQNAPAMVRADGKRFVLVEGLHRLEACRALGEKTVLVYLVQARPHRAADKSSSAPLAVCYAPTMAMLWFSSRPGLDQANPGGKDGIRHVGLARQEHISTRRNLNKVAGRAHSCRKFLDQAAVVFFCGW